MNNANGNYRGLRALILTRVSTQKQEEMYGHTWQEMQIRDVLIEPLGLTLDEQRHVIHDTYTGLEFRHRKALARILEMAERREFDVLCMEVLDRGLGRKGLPRELFRLQLRELGIRILTTDSNDHADDDTLEGQMMRLLKGYKAEEEINDFVRRARGGRRAKATGDKERGVPPRVVGNGHRIYGYKFILNEKGKRVGFELNHNIILVDTDGVEWTEVKVVIFIFESVAKGVSHKELAKTLNEKGIPSPYAAKGIKKLFIGDPIWMVSTISKILRQSAYWGEYRVFRTFSLFGEIAPGKKETPRRKTTDAEQIIVPVPAIITKALAEAALERARRNKDVSTRNNKHPQQTLLRAGLAKCGHCGGNLTAHPHNVKLRNGETVLYVNYQCQKNHYSFGRCEGCQIVASLVDPAAWEYAVSIIRDPSAVDKRVKELTADNSLTKYREKTRANLAEIRRKQASLRKDLSEMSQEGKLDKGTREYLSGQLQLLAKQEEEAKEQQAKEQAFQIQYNKLQERIAQFHQRCTEWREKLDDPEFIPSYEFKRDACEFFGITAIVYRKGHEPRFDLYSDPPSIVSLLS